ncbi:MAG: 2-hydroxychromene-2-carboxylate isomerase [Deltaproteobacteria bacterium]
MSLKFEFWYDFASTYSYLSASRIEDMARERGISVEWKPFLLGPIFKDQGWDTSPFNIYTAKGNYMWRDIERLSDKYGIPFTRPSQFPRNSVLASKIALVAGPEGWGSEISKLIYSYNFAEDKDISDSEILASALNILGKEPSTILQRAVSGENKGRLRAQTREAIDRGVFGAPSFVTGDEIFWGNDRLEDALDWHVEHAA